MASKGKRAVPEGADPDLVKLSDVTTPVELDDVLTVPTAFLDKMPLTIEWSQKFQTHTDKYYEVAFTNTTKANAKYYLFISSGKLDAFKGLDTAKGANGKLTVKVTTDFQYGQKDKTGKNRFLVYHEPVRDVMKQSRFIEGSFVTYGNMAGGFIDDKKGDNDASKLIDVGTRLLGDPLRKFAPK
ncbi:hypothetical protein SLS60_011020 [Paraconiothyrium brasiliense]|uniref:Uncharacterized protein n=1 Tax=Paraconiothyrium brasiliense TaxID=300254 RepID=A0ABR3QL12_9PLEO